MIYLQLFWSFFQIGLFSIGGGYAALPLIEQQIVDHHAWLTHSAFVDIVTISQMTPGPIAINAATFVGIRVAGLLGAVVATFGSIFPALFIVSFLYYIYYRYKRGSAIQAVLSCLRPTVVALIAGAGISILLTAINPSGALALASLDWVNLVLFVSALLVLRIAKWNPIAVMAGCGLIGLVINLIIQAI